MKNSKQLEALQNLVTAVAQFGEVYLAGLADEVIDGLEKAIEQREGYLVTQVESARDKPLKVTVLLSHVIDGNRTLVPLRVVENMPPTIQ